MHISKFLLAAGTVGVLVASFPAVAGPDNAAQAKMREALRQKVEEINVQTAPTPATPPVVAKPTPPPVQPAPEVAKPVERPATVVVPVPVEPPPVVVAPAPVLKNGKQDARFSELPTDVEDARLARLEEALRQKLAAEKASMPAVAPAVPASKIAPTVKIAPAVAVYIPVNMETVPSPFSGSKQIRLDELLRRYKADEITPQEYHTKRAAIVAEP
jgi:hypothetical protein